MRTVDVVASVRAEQGALEHIASLVYELWGRLLLVADGEGGSDELALRIGLVRDVWTQLDELGVDLNLPDLKSLVAAQVATHPTSSEAVTAISTPVGTESRVGTAAAPSPASLDPDQDAP